MKLFIMKNTEKSNLFITVVLCISLVLCACRGTTSGGYQFPEDEKNNSGAPEPGADFPKERDSYLWPFAVNSIWNTPVGEEAEYVHARLEPAGGLTIDEDYIVLTPEEPLMQVYKNDYRWATGNREGRCYSDGLTDVLFEAPIPQNWIVDFDSWDGDTPNAGIAVLMKDGSRLIEGQPFAHCYEGKPGTIGYVQNNNTNHTITGDGMYGAHGGSGLSAIGGTLRSHELTPASGPIRHALKINLFAAKNLYWDAETKGYRWPARTADGYAHDRNPSGTGYGVRRDTGTYLVVKECRMGALLALPPTIMINKLGLKTQPAKIIARALQDYGAYVVDDTAWDTHAFVMEWSPTSRFRDEFRKNWGFSFNTWNKDSDWKKDMDILFDNLHVVINNTPESIGGPGFRRQPYAPPFQK
jgi:hypothetical protein